MVIAVSARLRGTASSTGDGIPGRKPARWLAVGLARPRIGEDDRPSRGCDVEADRRSVGRLERDGRHPATRQVVAGAVIDGDGKPLRQRRQVIRGHRPSLAEHSRPAGDGAVGCVAWTPHTTVRALGWPGSAPSIERRSGPSGPRRRRPVSTSAWTTARSCCDLAGLPYDAAVSGTSSDALRIERSGPGGVVARVTLARPDVHNAFDATLIGDLRTAFATLAREEPARLRAVVLAGDGPSFCAGADLGWMRAAIALDTEGNEQDAMAMADMFETIDTCPVPVVARVHGAALGGGMGLLAVADVVIAESGTRFGFTETRLGILPSVISPFVVAKIGESHARALFPGGRRFDATRAARIGLVHEIVEGEEALDRAVDAAIADLLAAGPTAARAAKAIVREVRGLGHGSAKWHTARVIARQRTSDEAQEGFHAFTEKRRPAWAPDPD